MAAHSIVLEWLEKELFEGRLSLGQDLPDDREIAEAAGLTHSAAREALKHLEDMGIVRLYEGRKKTIIAQLVEDPVASAAPALRLHTAQAEYPVRDLVQARMLIEGWATENAEAGHPALQEARDILDRMQEPNISLGEFYQFEVSFHMALVRASGNALLSGLMGALRPALFDYLMSIAGTSELWSTTAARLRSQHRATVDAIESGDNAMAATLLRTQIRNEYEEAGIDLNAPRIPDTVEEPASSLEPVEIEDEDLLPSDPDFTISASLIDALNSIEPVKPTEPVKPNEPIKTTETAAEPATVAAEEPVASVPADSDPLESEHLSTVEDAPEQAPAQQSRVPEASAELELKGQESDEASVLRAEKHERRRSGTVSTPVHATVIKPVHRSQQPTGIIGGHVAPARQTSAEKGNADTNVLRAKPRTAHPALLSSAELLQQQKQKEQEPAERGFFSWRRKKQDVPAAVLGPEASAPAQQSVPESLISEPPQPHDAATGARASGTTVPAVENATETPLGHQNTDCEPVASEPAVSKSGVEKENETVAPVAGQKQGADLTESSDHQLTGGSAAQEGSVKDGLSPAAHAEQPKHVGKLKQFFGWGLDEKPASAKPEWTALENTGAEAANKTPESAEVSVEHEPVEHPAGEEGYIIEHPEPEVAQEENTETPSLSNNPLGGKNSSQGKAKSKKKKKRKR